MNTFATLSRVLLVLVVAATPAAAQLQPRVQQFQQPEVQPLLAFQAQTNGASGFASNALRASRQEQPAQWMFDTASGGGALRTPESFIQHWRVSRTIGLSLAFNGVMTLYGRYIMKEPGDPAFVVSIDTIHENLKHGLEWDDNSFSANNFRHPYQGAMYFGAARANGYDFYKSTAFAFAGSWLWEYTGEGHNPAFNDMLNTTVGGISFGETLYRFSVMITDNTASGAERSWRELGGLVVHPLRGVNRMLTGEAFTRHANPKDRFPSYFGGDVQIGSRSLSTDKLVDQAETRLFVSGNFVHGDPFHGGSLKPFEAFRFGIDLTFNNSPYGFTRFTFPGVLAGKMVGEKGGAKHVLAFSQRMDYLDNEAFTFGGQQLGFSWLTQGWKLWASNVRTEAHANWMILGGVRSDYANFTNRDYDYGPGLGYILSAKFDIKGYDFLSLGHAGYWVHSVNGNEADHYTNFTVVRGDVPIRGNLSIAAQYLLYLAERHYKTFDDKSSRAPELKLFFSFSLDQRNAVE